MTFACQPSTKILTLSRVRALMVLFRLATKAQLIKNKIDYDGIREYMQMLLYLSDFEELRIVQSLKDFASCDKEAFAKSLLLNHGDEQAALLLILNLCFDYEIHDHGLWEGLLHRLYNLKEYKTLSIVLSDHEKQRLWIQIPSLTAVGQQVMDHVWDGQDSNLMEALSMYRSLNAWIDIQQSSKELLLHRVQTSQASWCKVILAALVIHGDCHDYVSTLNDAEFSQACNELERLLFSSSEHKDQLSADFSIEITRLKCILFYELESRRAFHLLEQCSKLRTNFIQWAMENDSLHLLAQALMDRGLYDMAKKLFNMCCQSKNSNFNGSFEDFLKHSS
jgi:hypothetical protein